MTFPDHVSQGIADYTDEYVVQVRRAWASVDRQALEEAAAILAGVHLGGGYVYSCGNGGSAAIANHLVCDHCKGVQTDTGLQPRVASLSATIEMITAVANDVSYDEVFVYQLRTLARCDDALVAISSSGDSENIVRAIDWAVANGLPAIAMTGFSGGRAAQLASVSIHVDADNYGVVEDVHQSLMHVLAQYLRLSHMTDAKLVAERRF